jgi:lactate dehydrogenase-like 2-hydroxyacid dehydrogenase
MRVFVTRQVLPQGIQSLYDVAEVRVWEEDTPVPYEVLREEAAKCDALLTTVIDKVDEQILAHPNLKVVSNYGVGYDNINIAAATRLGIPIGNTPDAVTEPTADIAFALLMSAARRIPEGERYVRNGEWGAWHPQLLLGMRVWGATLGIVGFGRIGQAVAKRATGFNMRILYSGTPKPTEAAKVNAEHISFEDLLRQSDFVSLHTALNKDTYHLISTRELALMKPTAMLINTARGGVVDPDALYHALKNGTIAQAALDVTEPEPIPMSSPLLTLPNCLIVPHIGSATVAGRIHMGQMASANILAGLRGEKLPNCVNGDVYSYEGRVPRSE